MCTSSPTVLADEDLITENEPYNNWGKEVNNIMGVTIIVFRPKPSFAVSHSKQ